MLLDLIAAIGCMVIMICAFGLHVVTDGRFKDWITLPGSIRNGVLAVGASFLLRAVDFMTLVSDPVVERPGHVNFLGVVACLAFAFLACACLYHVVQLRLRQSGWDRVLWTTGQLRLNPFLRPTLLTESEVERTAHALGVHVNAKPGRWPPI